MLGNIVDLTFCVIDMSDVSLVTALENRRSMFKGASETYNVHVGGFALTVDNSVYSRDEFIKEWAASKQEKAKKPKKTTKKVAKDEITS